MKPLTKVALAMTVVPISLLVREVVRWQDAEAKHAVAEERFALAVEKSKTRQTEAGAAGVDRDTEGCVEWAMADCHPGAGSCDSCMDALRGCLETARRSDATCASIPKYAVGLPPPEKAAAREWQGAQAAKYGLTHFTCSAMFKFVQLHCHPLK